MRLSSFGLESLFKLIESVRLNDKKISLSVASDAVSVNYREIEETGK
jgi:anti-anti-sigma regulatory factor